MKKFLSIIAILVVVIAGAIFGAYYAGGEAEKRFNEVLTSIDNLDGVEIKNKTYKRGLFSSSANYDLVINPKILPNLILINDAVLHVDTSINHGISGLLFGIKESSNFSLVQDDEGFKKILNLFTKDKPLITTESKFSLNGDISTIIKFVDVDFLMENNYIKSNGFVIEADLEKENFLKNLKFKIANIDLNIEANHKTIKFNLKDLHSNVSYKEPFDINSFITLSTFPVFSGQGGIKNITFKSRDLSGGLNIELNDIKSNVQRDVKNELLSGKDDFSIDYVRVNDLKLKEIKADAQIENLSTKILEKVFKNINEKSGFTFDEYAYYDYLISNDFINDVGEFFAFNPSLKLNNFSFKNEKDNTLKLNFTIDINGYDKNKQIFENANALNFAGSVSSDVSISELIYQMPEISLFESIFIDQGILQKDGKGVRIDFKFIPETMDVMINDKIKLSEIK